MRELLTIAFLIAACTVAACVSVGPSTPQPRASAPPGPLEPQGVELRHALAAAVSADRIEKDIRTLVDFGTRHTLSETLSATRGIGAARRWVEQEFHRISAACGSCLEIITVSEVVSGERRIPEPTEVVSVLAIQRGTLDPDRMVMMTGDIDSRASDPLDGNSDAPGANDNASGLAGTIEAARVLSKYKFAGTIVYAALSGEEQGLVGGRIVANHALENGWRVKAVLSNDMIGNITGLDGVTNNSTARVFSEGTRYVETQDDARARRTAGGEVDSPSRNLARYIDRVADEFVPNLDVMMVYRLDRIGRGGHHRPFNERGIPGVRIMETHEHYHRQHQDLRTENGIEYGDVIAGVDFDYVRKLTALNVVSLAGMAAAPPFPANVSVAGAVQSSTTLNWTVPEGTTAENLAGYKIYWRLTTDAQWTSSRYAGKVATHTLDNIVIDNYFFGVASVSKDGYESPVVFPGVNGSFGE
jgi:Zn-dependent M28 family amino/carboxypeptidase